MQVAGRGLQVAVPQKMLQGHQIRAHLQLMGRKAVPQGMHPSLFVDPGQLPGFPVGTLDSVRVKMSPRLLPRKQISVPAGFFLNIIVSQHV